MGTPVGDTLGVSPPAAQAQGSWSSGGTGPRAHRDLLASPTLSLSLTSNRPVSLHGPTPLACVCQPVLDHPSGLLAAWPVACSPYADILPSGLPPRESRAGLQPGLCPPLCTSVSSGVKLPEVLPRIYRTQWGGYYFPELVRHCSIFFFFFPCSILLNGFMPHLANSYSSPKTLLTCPPVVMPTDRLQFSCPVLRWLHFPCILITCSPACLLHQIKGF